jgi:hypothetical protein
VINPIYRKIIKQKENQYIVQFFWQEIHFEIVIIRQRKNPINYDINHEKNATKCGRHYTQCSTPQIRFNCRVLFCRRKTINPNPIIQAEHNKIEFLTIQATPLTANHSC